VSTSLLYIGTVLTLLQSSGVCLLSIDFWNNEVMIGAKLSAISCNNLAGISSGPVALSVSETGHSGFPLLSPCHCVEACLISLVRQQPGNPLFWL
jgi:hypothetical protein